MIISFLSLNIFHLNLLPSIMLGSLCLEHIMVYYIITGTATDAICLIVFLELLHLPIFSLGWPVIVLRTIFTIILSTIISHLQVFGQFALNRLETAHFPLRLLPILFILRDHSFTLTLLFGLNLVHLSYIVRVIVLGHGFAGQRRQDSTHV